MNDGISLIELILNASFAVQLVMFILFSSFNNILGDYSPALACFVCCKQRSFLVLSSGSGLEWI